MSGCVCLLSICFSAYCEHCLRHCVCAHVWPFNNLGCDSLGTSKRCMLPLFHSQSVHCVQCMGLSQQVPSVGESLFRVNPFFLYYFGFLRMSDNIISS